MLQHFYLVTSSFEYFPGIPVYHSKDLVNWEHIGNCIERENQLPLKEAKSSGGVWAPTIRFHEGTFYVTATFDGIDPSLFFEDGKMYYCANDIGERYKKYGCEGISLVQMDPESGACIGEDKRIWSGAGGGWMEAPHIYHIGAYYSPMRIVPGIRSSPIGTTAANGFPAAGTGIWWMIRTETGGWCIWEPEIIRG